jgi:hypothetical protein
MANQSGQLQFEPDVFPQELREIQRRRANAGDRRKPLDLDSAPVRPGTAHDLTGLAFSGGGIRSASFSMGVVQHLIKEGTFARVDYLSTVSGGGYTGSCLSALMQGRVGGERLLVDRSGEKEAPALNYVRNGSNYLLPPGLLNLLRLPAVVVAGALNTLLLMLPPLVFLVFVTELWFELVSHYGLGERLYWIPVSGAVPFVTAVFLRPLRLGHRNWSSRDRTDRRAAGWLLLAVLSLLAVPALRLLGELIDHDWHVVLRHVEQVFVHQRAHGIFSPVLWVCALAVAALAAGALWFRRKLALLLLGATGPLFFLSLYFVICASMINSPVQADNVGEDGEIISGHPLQAAVARYREAFAQSPAVAGGEPRTKAENLLRAMLKTKDFDLEDYFIDWPKVGAGGDLVLSARFSVLPWMAWLHGDGGPELHLSFRQGWWPMNDSNDRKIVIDEFALLQGHTAWWLYLAGLGLFLYNYFCANINRASMHPFYRDRLGRSFLIRPAEERPAGEAVDLPWWAPADELRLSELGGKASTAPYHLINVALNLQGSHDPQLRQRKTVPFVLAQRFCGSAHTGFSPTGQIEAADPAFNLGTAMAISAAAAAPNMGALTIPSLSFILTLLNIRLNYWLPNSRYVADRKQYLVRRPWLPHLLDEAFGNASERGYFINCSDGGHIENFGVYELLRRRCRTIICVDGEADPKFTFNGFVTLQRYAQIDFGVEIELDLSGLRPNADGISAVHHAIGKIKYQGGEEGKFIYLKLSCTGDEPEYLRLYRQEEPAFPHESTADQFFGETSFEVYRALGYHAAKGLTATLTAAQLAATVATRVPHAQPS